MRKFEVMETHIIDTMDMKCPVCGTVDDLDEFIIRFYQCKMCRSELVAVQPEKKEVETR